MRMFGIFSVESIFLRYDKLLAVYLFIFQLTRQKSVLFENIRFFFKVS